MKNQLATITFLLACLFLFSMNTYGQKEPLLEEGQYQLTTILDPSEAVSFPTTRRVTVAKNDKGSFTITFPYQQGEKPLTVDILLGEDQLLFQVIDISEKYIFATIYAAQKFRGQIRGRYFIISGGGVLSGQGRFTLEKQE